MNKFYIFGIVANAISAGLLDNPIAAVNWIAVGFFAGLWAAEWANRVVRESR